MITLTTNNGQISIAPELITSIVGDADGSQINTMSDVVCVEESRQEIVRKIMEYKLGMIRYAATQQAERRDEGYVEMTELERLAGLEDSDA
ncbi:hypothetical protein [Cohnella zeiphila]|uniref:Flagellar protein FlbD n=1 Tax=Cohnella zeiphila TaxID=2761120 RepID=A0A7X0SND7_9BACL|nr:hypothetical protein [Cohnella zeiphila]MBB6731910.1 hypothetical protein [Cohnella zeiphila]